MFLLLTALTFPLIFAQPSCLNNGVMGPTEGKCYHFVAALQNFDDADIVCGIFDSVLVSITSGLENAFTREAARQKLPGEYWIGLTDLDVLNEWRWMDGKISNYSNWGTGFPTNDSTKRCAAVQWSTRWMNADCSNYSANFICQSLPLDEFRLTKCPPNAIEGPAGCFISNIVPQTHKTAEATCEGFGFNLAQVVNSEQALSLMSVAKESFYKTDFWIGISDPYGNGTWQFIDGTPINFTNWALGYPKNDGISFCVASRSTDGKWYNTECDVKKPSVCQQNFAAPSNEWKYLPETDSYYKGYRNSTGRIHDFETICYYQGAHLASIHSFQENMFVAMTVTNSVNDLNVAIGVYSSSNRLTWMDGTPWDYEYWYSTDAKATGSYPFAMQLPIITPYNMTWQYQGFDDVANYHFVCKKPRQSL